MNEGEPLIIYGKAFGELWGFAALCGGFSLLTFIVDLLIYRLGFSRKSMVGIRYVKNTQLGIGNTLPLCLMWTMGGFVVGLIGVYIGLLKSGALSTGMVGVFWPFVFTKIVSTVNPDSTNMEDTDEEEPE